jgi:aminopeptidase N
VAVAAACATLPSTAFAGPGTHGSDGLGDPFFPKAGNGGYDVQHYDLDLSWHRSGQLRGHAVIDATATQNLSQFDLDLRSRLEVGSVQVNGVAATFTQDGQELVITPSVPLLTPAGFMVDVEYAGKPRFVRDPDDSKDGWVPTSDGAVVVNEPQGSPTWFPCNDHPSDKATYDISVEVPRGLKAISNGTLEDKQKDGKRVTFDWHQPEPMATYLATATIGRFQLDISERKDWTTYLAVDPHADPGQMRHTDQVLRFFSEKFGPYPFTAAGGIVDPSDVGYSLEVQTKPYYPGSPGRLLLSHELAHQWFGDSVSLETWPDIWLNEGFATWAEWLWDRHKGGITPADRVENLYGNHGDGDDSFWNPPPGDPGDAAHLFDYTIYERGGMTLELLRQQVGTEDFLDILQTWASDHQYANADTQDFIDLSEAKSGMELSSFFQDWLYEPGKPPLP